MVTVLNKILKEYSVKYIIPPHSLKFSYNEDFWPVVEEMCKNRNIDVNILKDLENIDQKTKIIADEIIKAALSIWDQMLCRRFFEKTDMDIDIVKNICVSRSATDSEIVYEITARDIVPDFGMPIENKPLNEMGEFFADPFNKRLIHMIQIFDIFVDYDGEGDSFTITFVQKVDGALDQNNCEHVDMNILAVIKLLQKSWKMSKKYLKNWDTFTIFHGEKETQISFKTEKIINKYGEYTYLVTAFAGEYELINTEIKLDSISEILNRKIDFLIKIFNIIENINPQ